jgi:hypothetical protein
MIAEATRVGGLLLGKEYFPDVRLPILSAANKADNHIVFLNLMASRDSKEVKVPANIYSVGHSPTPRASE